LPPLAARPKTSKYARYAGFSEFTETPTMQAWEVFMKRSRAKKKARATKGTASPLAPRNAAYDPFRRRDAASMLRAQEPYVHVYGKHVICDTDTRGYATPDNKSLTEIVVDASSGFIPLWARDTTLRWRFQESSMTFFQDPAAAKQEISKLFGEAILAWGDAAPVKFNRTDSRSDFEIEMKAQEACDPRGCVLARGFFPDSGRHQLEIYPTMFNQDRAQQINTLAHEIGHIFGLRHFFAKISETNAASEIFGTHRPVSIMNYGDDSQLTADDRSDLKRLYQLAWSGQLKAINGTPIKLVKPFSVADGFGDFVADRLAAAAAVARAQATSESRPYFWIPTP